jgi:hypothetical protein
VPGEQFYKDLALPDAVEALAEHHYSSQNRHISDYEYKLLHELVARCRSLEKATQRTVRTLSKLS